MRPSDNKIYLASKSPRRRELLRQIGVEFELLLLRDRAPVGPEVNEAVLPDETPLAYVARVASDKAGFAQKSMLWRRLPIRPVLAADTTVEVDGRILAKPGSVAEAMGMLTLLAGRTHLVHTSVAVRFNDESLQVTQSSEVAFAEITPAQMAAYAASAEPHDKAGGYAVQGMAALFIREIAGSYSGIMGLPLFETAQLLQQAGVKIL